MPIVQRSRDQFDDKGGVIFGVEEQESFLHLVSSSFREFESLPEFEPLAIELLQAGVLRSPVSNDDEKELGTNPPVIHVDDQWWIAHALMYPINSLLESAQTFDVKDAQILAEFDRWIYRRTTEVEDDYRAIWPLFHFESPISDYAFGNGIKLSTLSGEDKTQIWNGAEHSREFLNLSVWQLGAATHMLSADYSRPSQPTGIPHQHGKAMGRIITSLRLKHKGNVGVPAGFEFRIDDDMSMSMSIAVSENEHFCQRFKKAFRLDVHEVQALNSILTDLDDCDEKNLAVALRWFNHSYSDRRPEDRLIKFAICLESTVLADMSQELRYRLALRGSALLSSVRPPAQTHQLLKLMYDVRSKIVHQGRTIKDIETDQKVRKLVASLGGGDFVEHCEDVARDVLRTYVSKTTSSFSIQELNRHVDNRLVADLENAGILESIK